MTVNFGTDGWRAVISDTFTFHNLRQVTQAIADAAASGSWQCNDPAVVDPSQPKKVVIGFDTRFLSDRYATEAARVLAANGIQVYLSQGDSPTPVISYATRYLNAIAGL